jgi:RNA polymerase sigma-70 factor (ECF subfamily)
VTNAIRRLDYDPQRGSFRGWLFTVVRNELRTFLRREKRLEHGSGDSQTMRLLLEQADSHAGADECWERDYRERVFTWAARQVQQDVTEQTWQAFWRTSIEKQSGKEVARALGMTVTAVYVARSRVTTRLRELVQQLEGSE